MNIHELFSTRERVKIINEVIYTEGSINLSFVAKKLRLSKGLVSKFMNLLEKNGIVKKKGRKAYVEDNVYTRAVKIMQVLQNFKPSFFQKHRFVRGVGMYGSCAKGENTKDSDIDIWVKISSTSELELARFSKKLKRKLPYAKLLFLTDEKIKNLSKNDSVFYHSLLFGSIRIYGGNLEH